MLKKAMLLTLSVLACSAANAGVIYNWSSEVLGSGNIRNNLTLSFTAGETRDWLNSRVITTLDSGLHVFRGTYTSPTWGSGYTHRDYVLEVYNSAEDSGIMGPLGALIVPGAESADRKYSSYGWGDTFNTPGVPPGGIGGYVLTLTFTPDANGALTANSFLTAGVAEGPVSFPIVNGVVVPEPSALGLLALGGLALIRRR